MVSYILFNYESKLSSFTLLLCIMLYFDFLWEYMGNLISLELEMYSSGFPSSMCGTLQINVNC